MRKKCSLGSFAFGTLIVTNLAGMCAEAVYLANPKPFHEAIINAVSSRENYNLGGEIRRNPGEPSKNRNYSL